MILGLYLKSDLDVLPIYFLRMPYDSCMRKRRLFHVFGSQVLVLRNVLQYNQIRNVKRHSSKGTIISEWLIEYKFRLEDNFVF